LLGAVGRVHLVEDDQLPVVLLGELTSGHHEALVVAVVVCVAGAEDTDLHGAVVVDVGLALGHAPLFADAGVTAAARVAVLVGRGR
jgi:hypothetical protein